MTNGHLSCDGLDRPTLAEYSIDESNEAFTMDDLGNRDSVIIRDGNNVNYDIDNLKSKRGNAGGKGLKSESRRAETVRDHIHAWPASSTGTCWNTSKKMDRKVKIVNYIRWLSLRLDQYPIKKIKSKVEPSKKNGLSIGKRIKKGLRTIGLMVALWSQVLSTPSAIADTIFKSEIQRDIEAHLSKLNDCLKTFLHQDRIRGFYDYQDQRWPLVYERLDPTRIDIPKGAWPLDNEKGFGSFLRSINDLHIIVDNPNTNPKDRVPIFEGVTKLIYDNPFLQYQAFYYSGDGRFGKGEVAKVPNNIFVQFMSKQLMLLALKALPGLNPENEKKLLVSSLFPNEPNGRTGASLFYKHGVLLVGFGIQPDVDKRLYTRGLPPEKAWKSVKGGMHAFGSLGYAYFIDDYIREINRLFDLYPRHLVSAGKPFISITVHGGYYINEMDDFANKYYPMHAGAYKWLGYLHGEDLNTFGSGVSIQAGMTKARFRTTSMYGEPSLVLPSHGLYNNFSHELTHYLHATVAHERPDFRKRLNELIDLGVKEKSNIRAIDCDLEKFGGSGIPAYEWFRKNPQEFVATVANVAHVNPIAVLRWCVALATSRDEKIQPLNHMLWMLDAHSLDSKFKETNKSFMPTLQPTGYGYNRVNFNLERDEQGRITSMSWFGGKIGLIYGDDGFARVSKAMVSR